MSEEEKISVVLGHSSVNDMSLMGRTFEPAGILMPAFASNAHDMADHARSLGVDCVLFSPTLPGMTPALIQELLLNEDKPIAAVGLIPAGTNYAAEYQRFGMKGFVITPLDANLVQNLPNLVREAVRYAREERRSRSFTPVSAEDALAILDRGGWSFQTIALFSPKGGVGKSTLSANLAAALGMIGLQPTLLIDADMSRANAHVFFNVDLAQEPRNLFSLYTRVIADGLRTARYTVQAQTLQANIQHLRGKLDFLPGIPKPHMAGLEQFTDPDNAPLRTSRIFADLLAQAKGFYQFRVLDVGPDINLPIHFAALQEADTVLLIVTPEKTAIGDIQNILPTLEKSFGTLQKFRLVLNQFDDQFGITPKEVVKYLGGKVTILGSIPYAPTETRLSINTGEPLVLQKKLTPVAEELIKLASKFYPPLEAVGRKKATVKAPGLRSRISNILSEE